MSLRSRQGSALILVLLMTLAVAALAIAAIFLSSSAGLLSRFYDKEREFRLAAESAIQVARSRLEMDSTLIVPDTGMLQVLSGYQVTDASGAALPRIFANVYAATTGDTSGLWLPRTTLVAVSYDSYGVRYGQRSDFQRESFSRFGLFTHNFSSSYSFGPGTVHGRVHTNGTWRNGNAPVFRDTVTATAFSGSATYSGDSATVGTVIPYPEDSTYSTLSGYATAANLNFTPLATDRGTRLEFVALDADGDSTVGTTEGFFRVFDQTIAASGDTLRLAVNFDDYFWQSHSIIQNQCGAFYWIASASRWEFFTVSKHRATWVGARIMESGNYPVIGAGTYDEMNDYDDRAVYEVLRLPTARCFPIGSPYLMASERFVTTAYALSQTAADSVEWGRSVSQRYGGMDTTFTPRPRSCQFNDAVTATGACESWSTPYLLGGWVAFPGTAVGTIPTSVRQSNEAAYLWPLDPTYNAASRRVAYASTGPLFVSGVVAGNATLLVNGRVTIIDELRYATDPNAPETEVCRDQLGIVAVGDILVANSGITRLRFGQLYANVAYHLGSQKGLTLHGSFMSLSGTVGVVRNSTPGGPWPFLSVGCPTDVTTNIWHSHGGCLSITGSMAMRDYTPVWAPYFSIPIWPLTRTGFRWHGTADRCQTSDRRPPFFPLTNRLTPAKSLEVAANRVRTPVLVRSLLLSLKGKRDP